MNSYFSLLYRYFPLYYSYNIVENRYVSFIFSIE